ncbi:subtilisin-like protease sbt1.5 [Quercus suber]|uniref:Subtilisin-like protease sbt1.5 n=1 Tax=Quercus suber TaxID=58331 RepID=A0AAW0LK29_QUESU
MANLHRPHETPRQAFPLRHLPRVVLRSAPIPLWLRFLSPLHLHNTFYGFTAKLDSDQAESLLQSDLVLGVYEETLYHLHTNRTPEFLGLYTETSQNTQFPEQASHDFVTKNSSAHEASPKVIRWPPVDDS